MQSLHATGGQSHINCTWVAASHMQIVPQCPPVACKLYPLGRQSHSTWIKLAEKKICMRLAATRVQFACDWRQLGYKTRDKQTRSESTSSTMLLTIQRTALGYLVWKMRWYHGWQSHTKAKFAYASGQLRAKPPVFCKHAARTITQYRYGIWIKKLRRH
jgi:hypothetical protein